MSFRTVCTRRGKFTSVVCGGGENGHRNLNTVSKRVNKQISVLSNIIQIFRTTDYRCVSSKYENNFIAHQDTLASNGIFSHFMIFLWFFGFGV